MNSSPDVSSEPDLSAGHTEFLVAEIERWQAQGIISARLARRLLAQYEPGWEGAPQPFDPQADWPPIRVPLTAGMVLLYLGGILILTAAALLVANVWQQLGPSGRFALAAIPAGVLYTGGAFLGRSSSSRRLPGLAMLFFGCLLVPFAIWLGSVWLFGPPASVAAANRLMMPVALLTLVVHLGTLFAFRSPLLTVLYPLVTVWAAFLAGVLIGPEAAGFPWEPWFTVAVAGLILLAVGIYCGERGMASYAVVPNLVGIYSTLFALFILNTSTEAVVWQVVAVLASLGAIAASIWRRNQVYLFAGALFLMMNIFYLGVEYFKDTAGLPVTLIICGALCMGVGYGVQRVRKGYLEGGTENALQP